MRPDRPLEPLDAGLAAVDRRLQVDGLDLLAGDSAELAEPHDRVLDACHGNAKRQLGAALVALRVDLRAGHPPAQLARDRHGVVRRVGELLGVGEADLHPELHVGGAARGKLAAA